jgi:hypothetical protein
VALVGEADLLAPKRDVACAASSIVLNARRGAAEQDEDTFVPYWSRFTRMQSSFTGATFAALDVHDTAKLALSPAVLSDLIGGELGRLKRTGTDSLRDRRFFGGRCGPQRGQRRRLWQCSSVCV